MRKILALLLATVLLMTSIFVMPAVADGVTIENFEAFKLNVYGRGGGNGFHRILAYHANFPFTALEANSLVGLYLNGTATDTSGNAVIFENVVVTASEADDSRFKIDFAPVTGLDVANAVTYTFDIYLSREPVEVTEPETPEEGDGEITIHNFEKFTLNIAGKGAPNTSRQRLIANPDTFPFEVTETNELVGLYINGTATDNSGNVVKFENVEIVASEIRANNGYYNVDFLPVSDFKPTDTTITYTFNLTLSRETLSSGGGGKPSEDITIDNFESFKLDIYTQGAPNGSQQRIVSYASAFPFTVTEKDALKGLYLNGTATDANGNVVNFKNVVIESSIVDADSGNYKMDFAKIAEFNSGINYTYDITLSREPMDVGGEEGGDEPDQPSGDITVQNFEKFTLNVGAKGGGTGWQRIVVYPDTFPFEVTQNDELVGLYINGTATDNTGKVVKFTDVEVISSEVRANGAFNIDFAPVDDFDTSSSAVTYTYNLTLSREKLGTGDGGDSGDEGGDENDVTIENFEPITLTISAVGGVQSMVRIIVPKSNFPFTVTQNNAFVGCMLNGKATYLKDDGAYPAEVIFENVAVKQSDVRDSGYALDFLPPVNMPGSGGYYEYNLTLSPVPPPAVDFPEDSTTFFLNPNQFSCTGNWTVTGDSGYNVVYATGSVLGNATAMIVIPEDGTYTVKGLSPDFLNTGYDPGFRHADVKIGDNPAVQLGTHGENGYRWQTVGTYEFKKGEEVLVEVCKSSGQWARLAALSFSTDPDYVSSDSNLAVNFELAPARLGYLPFDDNKINMLVMPDDFDTDLGTWIEYKDGSYDILRGVVGGTSKEATASINIATGGIYYVWGLAYDNSESGQGTKAMKLGVNGTQLEGELGTFGETISTGANGDYDWQYAGKVWMGKNSELMLSLYDTSANGAKFAAAVVTSDANFKGISKTNFPSYKTDSKYQPSVNKELIDISGVNTYGNALSFTLKNRTENPIERGVLTYCIYNKDGQMVDIAFTEFEDLGAYTGLDKISLNFGPPGAWTKGKIMLWDGFDSMKPLCEAKEFIFSDLDRTDPDEFAGGNYGTVSDYMVDYVFRNEDYAKNEYFVRSGVKNTIAKLKRGEDVTIAYVGGSNTEAETWRPLTTAWFKKTYPNAKITEVALGVSGTKADLGACRIDGEVLIHDPDLIFFDYAGNGGLEKDIEGLALKIWGKDPTTDIIFTYTGQTYYFNDEYYGSLKIPENPEVQERITKYYNIPSVFFAYQPLDMYEQDELTLTSKEEGKVLYTTDTVHMTYDGAYLAASAIARMVLEQDGAVDPATYQITPHTIPGEHYKPAPYYPWDRATNTDNWDFVKFEGTWLDCSRDANGNFKNYEHEGGSTAFKLFNKMVATKTPGSSITIKFKGTDIALFEAGGPFSGQVKVTIDGVEQPEKLVLYDATFDSKLRYQYKFITNLEDKEHTVTFTLDSELPDKSALQSQYPTNDKYQLNELYIGKILLNGELLNANE